MDFTQNERKVLRNLINYGRATDMEIAKGLEISSQAVGKIRKKLESEGIIQGYETRLSFRKLGINTIVVSKVRLAPQLFVPEAAKEFMQGLRKVPYILGVYRTPNQEFVITAGFRTLKEHDLFSSEVMRRYGRHLQPVYSTIISRRGFLKHDFSALMDVMLETGDGQEPSILDTGAQNNRAEVKPLPAMTKNEKRVLHCLIDNGRSTDMEIAKQLNISSQAVGKIRKKLESEGLIEGYSARIDMGKIGINTLVLAKMKIAPVLFSQEGLAAVNKNPVENHKVISAYRSAVNDLILLAAFRDHEEFDEYSHRGLEAFNDYIISLDVDSFSTSAVLKSSCKELYRFVVTQMGCQRSLYKFPDRKEELDID